VIDHSRLADLDARLQRFPRFPLALLPTPIQPLANLGANLDVSGLWMKRDDLTGLEGGGNKTRKLEYLVGDALASGADMLATIGAIQSNHTRQTAAAAAKAGLKCALLHCAWTRDAGPQYRQVGNLLLSRLMGADLYADETERPIEDQGPLVDFVARLKDEGHQPYQVPAGASEHPLGCLGYVKCAAEIAMQAEARGIVFDYVVHCTGSCGTQAGLLAGFAALGLPTQVIGVADDGETAIKKARVHALANDVLQRLEVDASVTEAQVDVIASSKNAYGVPGSEILEGIRRLAQTEGLIADPVYEGRTIRGLIDLAAAGHFAGSSDVLVMHLGGTPAIHAYADLFGAIELKPFKA